MIWEAGVAACARQTTPQAHRARSLALERLATTAFAADDLATALDIMVGRLDLDVPASHYRLSRVLQARVEAVSCG